MADVITRFKLETSQYDSKLRDTVKNLKEVVHMNELAGKDFREFSDAAIQAARGLGQTATGATNAKDKVKELVAAYNDMAKTYNDMSEAMKNSEGGKALAASLQELQGRIREAKAEMNATPGVLDKLASKFVVNIDAIKLFNLGLKAADAALGVAKDAFFASEATVDEWGRVMDSSKSLYEGFLTAINTGDISGYLSRIDDIVKAARTAYDELDRLGTMQRIQSPQKSAQQLENERMRMMIQTGTYIAPMDGRSNAVFNGRVMQSGDKLTAGQIRYLEQQLKGGMQKSIGLVGNEVKQSTKAINALFDRQAAELGLSKKEFMAGTSTMAEFDKRIQGYQQYRAFEREHTTYDSRSGISHRDNVANPYEAFKSWGVFRVDGDRYNQLLQLIAQRDQQMSQAYSMQGQAYRTINRAEGVTVRNIMNGGSGSGSGTGGSGGTGNVTKEITYAADSIAAQQALVSALSKQWSEAGADVRNSYLAQLIEAEKVLKRMKDDATMFRENSEGRLLERGPIQTTGLGMVTGSFKNAKVEGLSPNLTNQGKSLAEDGKNVAAEWQSAASAIGAVGAAMSQIEDPAAKVMGTIAQAIATIALTFASSLKGTVTPWDWIAAAAAGTATMISTISAIHSATGYAQGGIVKGNSYSGDNIGAMVDGSQLVGLNAGEVVLTKAMQNNLASQLQGGGWQGGQLEAVVTGEQLRFILNTNGRRTGRGEFVTTNFR